MINMFVFNIFQYLYIIAIKINLSVNFLTKIQITLIAICTGKLRIRKELFSYTQARHVLDGVGFLYENV